MARGVLPVDPLPDVFRAIVPTPQIIDGDFVRMPAVAPLAEVAAMAGYLAAALGAGAADPH